MPFDSGLVIGAIALDLEKVCASIPTVVAGEFNVQGNFGSIFGRAANFTGWTNTVGVLPSRWLAGSGT